MRKNLFVLLFVACICSFSFSHAEENLIPEFKLETNELTLQRLARPGTPFIKAGRRAAILGDESGSFEAWVYPLKLLRNFEFSFFVGSSTRPVQGKYIVRTISVSPEATSLTYTYQSFTVKAIYIVPVEAPGAVILLNIHSAEPITIVCSFFPSLQPMWPAGIGGQYAYWDDNLKGYVLSEPTRKNHAVIGSPAASGISYTPAHMLSDTPNEFKIEVLDPQNWKNKYIPICLAGGKGAREDVVKAYENLAANPEKYYRQNLEHYRHLRENTLKIQTPDKELNLAFEWAKLAFDSLVVDNPDLGRGLVAGLGSSGMSGRPGFGWFFGGDAYINTFSLLSYGASQTAREALAFTQKWQRKDGKMAHELSQAAAYIDWWNDYPYGYIHGDTTPYYIAAMYDYVKMTGDTDFIRKSWASLKAAFEWCLSTDANNDGLMDNKKAGLGALEYGALTGIETDIYLAAVWIQAAYAMQQLAEIAGEKVYREKGARLFEKARLAFDQKFWDDDSQFYAYAFNAGSEHVREISPWCALGLMWDFGRKDRSLRSLERICSSELCTDWGIRSISSKSEYYQPLNYNYGAVWPFLTSWVTTALYKHHLPLQGHSLLISTARHTFDRALGSITEVFSGEQNIWPQEAVAHQGFSSAGVVLPFVRGLAGLEGDALKKTVTYSPHFPADWEKVSINNYRVGEALFSFHYKRSKEKITVSIKAQNAQGYRVTFSPALGAGSRIKTLLADGKPLPFQVSQFDQVVQPLADILLKDNAVLVEIAYTPTLEILPVVPECKVGERNKGLKIISVRREAKEMIVQVEGLANEWYELSVFNEDRIESIEGARVRGNKLRFQISKGQGGEFLMHTIRISIRETEA